MVSYNGHHQFNSRIPEFECLPSFEWLAHGKPNNGRQACLVSRLSSPSPLGRISSVDFDVRPPKFSTIFHFIGVDCMHDEGAVTMFRMNTSLLFPKLSSRARSSIIIQKYPTRNNPVVETACFYGKSVDIFMA